MGLSDVAGALWAAVSDAPTVLSRLRGLGLLQPRRGLAAACTAPWLVGRGVSVGIASQINAMAYPGRTAVIDDRGELTWLELDRRVNQLAGALRARGVRPGDAVATVLRNGREQVEALLASQKLGAVAMPLNTWSRHDELVTLLERSVPRVLVYDTRHAGELAGAVPDGVRLLAVDHGHEAIPHSEPYEPVLAGQRTGPPPPFRDGRGSARLVIHTSGTTGKPKAASRGTGTEGAESLVHLLQLVPFRHDDVVYCPAPMFHSFGLMTFVVATIAASTLVLPDTFEPERTLEDLRRHRATTASLVPVMVRRTVSVPGAASHDTSSLRILLTSGSAMPVDLRNAVRDVFGEVLYDLYGSTEAGWIAIATPEDVRRRPEAVGRPVEGVDVVILDEDARPLPPGERGRIGIGSGARFEGYTSGESVKEHGGYLDTGDIGFIDDEGYLHVTGRADDMVVIGGENVYPAEVENVVREIDGVEDVAVVGISDEEYGEVLHAFVVGEADREEITATCRERLASFKVPREVHIVDDLPRTSTGKVLRRELRDRTN